MSRARHLSLVIIGALAAACLGDPVGPRGTLVLRVTTFDTGTVVTGAPGRLLPIPVVFEVVDGNGLPIPGAQIEWNTSGLGSYPDHPVTQSDRDGRASAGWVLGINAEEPQMLIVRASVGSHEASLRLRGRGVPVEVAELRILAETTLVKLGVSDTLPVVATDPFGNDFLPVDLHLATLDTVVATVDSTRVVFGRQRGFTRVAVDASGVADTAWLHVTQIVTEIRVSADSLLFHSFAQEQEVSAALWDDQGLEVADSLPTASVVGSGVVELQPGSSFLLRSLANGTTQVLLQAGGVTRAVPLTVSQVADSIRADVVFGESILTLPVGATLPIVCAMYDANGYPISAPPTVLAGAAQTVTEGPCGQQTVRKSGHDTLRVMSGMALQLVPVVVAAAPLVTAPLGSVVVADTLPGQPGHTWSPSARRNASGELEVYYTAYSSVVDSSGFTRGDLHRLIWTGGYSFLYDGIAVSHDDDICSPQGQGIENMAIVSRADAAGWRMFYAAGSNKCYGWQVFSAVSGDGKTWTKEPGIRLGNGGTIHGPTQWPVGEGMVVYQSVTGAWEMIVGGYEPLTPIENKWQIVRWQSVDQLNWTYIGPLLTTRDMPAGWQGSVYSPTVREIAPGLWRMLFSADGRGTPGGRSAIWSAVSVDRLAWQLEGEVLGAASANLYYAALADDLVVFIRQDAGGVLYLAAANVTMP